MQTSSLNVGYCYLTLNFIDDNTRYVWAHSSKDKSENYEKFVEWKALVENSTEQKLKTLRSDNRGEHTSAEFIVHLKKEGVCHEFTVPKTPQ